MDAVQAPIVQVIGDLIREAPGTISLGQGVVHYGPPAAALDAVRASLADPATHEYQNGDGLPVLVERLAEKLRRENGIDLGSWKPRDGNRRREHGVHARGVRDHRAWRRDHREHAVLLQSRDGDSDGRLHGPSRLRPTIGISRARMRCAPRSPIARARS